VTTQQLLIILMCLMFVAGGMIGHAIGYMRRRDQLAVARQHLRIAYGRIRALEVEHLDAGRRP
jgi:hypothetical protein